MTWLNLAKFCKYLAELSPFSDFGILYSKAINLVNKITEEARIMISGIQIVSKV